MGCSSSKLNESINILRENEKEKDNPETLEIIEKIKEQNIKNENNKINKYDEQENENKNDDIKVKAKIRIPKATKLKEIELSFSEKESSKSVANSLPKRTQTNLKSFKDLIKSKTEKLNQKLKSYVLFLWICDNITYDAKSYYSGAKVDCTPEGVFKTGLSVCSGYALLYKDIALYLNLEVECVSCYAKGASYRLGQNMYKSNHEYNVIKLDNKWCPIDSTWGAGYVDGQNFNKCFKEIYFLPNPELLITSHFPIDDKWQLTKEKYTLEEFIKWPIIKLQFYEFGFKTLEPKEGVIELKNSNKQKFIFYGEEVNKKGASCKINLFYESSVIKQNNLCKINFYNDRLEIDCIFNKKGEYEVEIFGNNERGKETHYMLEFKVIVEKDAKEQLSFPKFYCGKEEITIIEPIYDFLKSGEKIKFKIKSDLDEIIIIDQIWNYLKKNKEGYFEFETIIKSSRGQSLKISNKNGTNNSSTLAEYNII